MSDPFGSAAIDSSLSRKRGRSASPKPRASPVPPTSFQQQPLNSPSTGSSDVDEVQSRLVRHLQGIAKPNELQSMAAAASPETRKLSLRNQALNSLLQLTNVHGDKPFSLTSDAILHQLVRIATVECLDWKGPSKTKNQEDDEPLPQLKAQRAWLEPPTAATREWADHWKSHMKVLTSGIDDSLKVLETILIILRNLSFVGANLRLMAYTPPVLDLLIGCLYEGACRNNGQYLYQGIGGAGWDEGNLITASSSNTGGAAATVSTALVSMTASTSISLSALQTLLHLLPHLDISGQKILCDRLFYYTGPSTSSAQTNSTTRSGGTTPSAASNNPDGPVMPSMESAITTTGIGNRYKRQRSMYGQVVSGRWGFGSVWMAKRLDTKEDVMVGSDSDGIGNQFVLEMTGDYLQSLYSVFSALQYILTNRQTPRNALLMALDFLQELVNQARTGMVGDVDYGDDTDNEDEEEDSAKKNYDIPTLRAVLVSMPNACLDRLIELLYVPRLGPDALEYVDPVHNIVTRVTTLKLLTGYDAIVDTDIRDRTLDILVPLLELDSPRMAMRLGTQAINGDVPGHLKGLTTESTVTGKTRKVRTNLFLSLVPILATKAGRNEASMLASQLLRELSMAKENQLGLSLIQDRLVELSAMTVGQGSASLEACERVSRLVWNHLYPVNDDDDDDDDGDDEEEDEEAEGGDDQDDKGEGDDSEEADAEGETSE